MFLESAGDGTAAVSPGVCGRKSSVQAERKQQQPADHGAPSPSERSARVCSYSNGHEVAVLHAKSRIVVACREGSP